MAQSQGLKEVLQNCSAGDELICTAVHSLNNGYLTENRSYTVKVDDDGDLCIIDDEGDELINSSSLFTKLTLGASPSTQGNAVIEGAVISGDLDTVLADCSEGDYITCIATTGRNSRWYTIGKSYQVLADIDGELCIRDDDNDLSISSRARFEKVQPIQAPQLAPREESDDTPKSVVDGDYSEHDTWGIGNKPHKKVKQWKPDTIREDIDIMESIRHACNRT